MAHGELIVAFQIADRDGKLHPLSTELAVVEWDGEDVCSFDRGELHARIDRALDREVTARQVNPDQLTLT